MVFTKRSSVNSGGFFYFYRTHIHIYVFQILIHSEKEFKKIVPPMFENGSFDEFMYKLDTAIQQCNRLELKSLATLLS